MLPLQITQEHGKRIRLSASTCRATVFHSVVGETVDADELVNLILIGLVTSLSEKTFVEEGDKAGGYGDFGSAILGKGVSPGD
jgi:hypothetical protein